MRKYSFCFVITGVVLTLIGPMVSQASAQNTIGGHIGFGIHIGVGF